jgi:formate/nitrite transporter FocA (FNT family)
MHFPPCRLPISAFAAIGFEHCIANMFLIPLAIAYGAPIDAQLFVAYNLIPSTLGNWVGGAICVSTVYAFIYGLPPKVIFAWVDSKRKKA